MCSPWLPDEMWIFLFRYLSLSERLSIRATCKYFRDLVDDSNLWKNWILDLSQDYDDNDDEDDDKYDKDFWELLRRRRVTYTYLSSYNGLSKVVNELPGLTTIIIDGGYMYDPLNFLVFRSFTNLERLYLTDLQSPINLEEFSHSVPQRLTHLTLCLGGRGQYPLPVEISLDSPFQNLRSFSYHCSYDLHPVNALHFFLSSLPQLQHFSLSMSARYPYEDRIADLPPLNNCSLTSLELVKCTPENLPLDLMKMFRKFPFLQSLGIYCQCYGTSHDALMVSSWLKDLPALTSLLVSSRTVSQFVSSIPRGLTRLSLLADEMNSDDIAALSPLLPNLCHLRLEPRENFLGSDTALIPQYFPKLKTLRIRFKDIFSDDDAFLSLASLKELEVLEIYYMPPPALFSQLRALTNNRVWIRGISKEEQLQSCSV